MRSSASDSPSERHITVAADTAHLATLRSEVGELVRASGGGDDVVQQFELVVSELATNVIQHSDATEVEVLFRSAPGHWVLDVSNAADTGDAPHLPDVDALSGRGLFIVHAVMDSVEVLDIDGTPHIRCTKLAG